MGIQDASQFELTSRAIALLRTHQVKKVLQSDDKLICEWPNAGLTFIYSPKYLAIVRTGAAGGDTYDVHGGWRYLNRTHSDLEWNEIKYVQKAYL